jgi:hypothetical protein
MIDPDHILQEEDMTLEIIKKQYKELALKW